MSSDSSPGADLGILAITSILSAFRTTLLRLLPVCFSCQRYCLSEPTTTTREPFLSSLPARSADCPQAHTSNQSASLSLPVLTAIEKSHFAFAPDSKYLISGSRPRFPVKLEICFRTFVFLLKVFRICALRESRPLALPTFQGLKKALVLLSSCDRLQWLKAPQPVCLIWPIALSGCTTCGDRLGFRQC